GATEQASTVQQLTASVEEISSQTNLNAQNADEASGFALTAKSNANTGNSQMKEMLSAMDAINTASGSIYKIIKVIEDIAFQ
ncbi:MAG TPA: methyl-accepting chemotaxis protein, partial [Clostridiales bacterium]|nr:methyl-accepting chemotaxis protein [Clostridiales bacterium]